MTCDCNVKGKRILWIAARPKIGQVVDSFFKSEEDVYDDYRKEEGWVAYPVVIDKQ